MTDDTKDTGMTVTTRQSADNDYTEFGVELDGAWYVLAAYPSVKVAERAARAAEQAAAATAQAEADAAAAKSKG